MKRGVFLLAGLLALAVAAPALAEPPEVLVARAQTAVPAKPSVPLVVPYASINATVFPGSRQLSVSARLRVNPLVPGLTHVHFRLHPQLSISRVMLNDRKASYQRAGEWLHVKLPRAYKPGGKWVVAVDYAGRPLWTEHGTKLQDVGPEGAFLHPDGRWIPQVDPPGPLVASVHVKLPATWRATAPAARQTVESARQTYHFEFGKTSPLAVAAGPYTRTKSQNLTYDTLGVQAPSQGTALAAFYKAHGLTPPGQAARTLVELPAGYAGFAAGVWQAAPRSSGGPAGSLAALAWQPRRGPAQPWLSHSLAAYTGDLLTEKQQGPRAYRDRLAARLASYQAFARRAPQQDLPLGTRMPIPAVAWGPLVEDKGALVWSLVRETLGEERFWSLLRKHQAALARGPVTTEAWLALAGHQADFLTSWLNESGLPQFRLEDTRVEEREGAYHVTGVLTQAGPTFRVPLALALIGESHVERVDFQTFDARVPFHFVSPTKPLRLLIDPAEQLPISRRRHLRIGDGLSRPGVRIVYGTQGEPLENRANQEAAVALQARLKRATRQDIELVADHALTPEARRGSLVLVGRPRTHSVLAAWADQLPVRFIEGQALWWQGRTYHQPRNGVVQTIANPDAPDETVVAISALGAAGMTDALNHLSHDVTYCLFEGGQVLAEGDAMRPFPDLEAVLY